MGIAEKIRDYTPGVTIAASLAAAAAYLGYREFAVTVLVVSNALWLLVYAFDRNTKAWLWCGIVGGVMALVSTGLVLTRPSAEIVLPSPVSRKTAVALKYEHISLDKRLWLVIKGKNNFWPVGTCDLETGSLIEPTRLSLMQKSGEWAYPDLVFGSESEAGAEFTLYVLLVDELTDRKMAEEVKTNAENCTGRPWAGRMKLPDGDVLTSKPVRRRTD
jgi:hypothetical protein